MIKCLGVADPAVANELMKLQMLRTPIYRPEGPEDDANKHPDGESRRGKDDVSCFCKSRPFASEVGDEGN